MSDESNAPAPEGRETGEAGIGKILREARQAANIDVNKVCTDLRISPSSLDALEQGNYHLLPGDPYIRALLGSLARYLGLDPAALVQKYNKEIGAVNAAPSIAPYKDRTQTHTATHKQIFIGIFAVLFIVLFLLFRKLNVNEADPATVTPPPASALPSDTLAIAPDTLLESKSLAPDTSLDKASPDSGEARGAGSKAIRPPAKADSSNAPRPVPAAPGGTSLPNPAPGAALPGTSGPAAAAGAAASIDSSHLILAVIKPLIDSVGVKVMRFGKEDFATVLRLGKQMQVSHTDTITVMVSKRKSVEVTFGGKTLVPDKKRFKLFGNTVRTF